MTDDRCLECRRYPATRLAISNTSGRRYFCSARCAAAWAVGELDRRRAEDDELERFAIGCNLPGDPRANEATS